MKIRMFLQITGLFGSIFMLAGCSLFLPDVKNVNYYDLNYSGKERYKVKCRLEMRNFHNISPARLNLMYSKKDSVIELDQYNYWVQSPEIMLRRFLLNAIEPVSDSNEKLMDVSLTVFDFKFDTVAKEAVFGVYLVLKDKEREAKFEKNYIFRLPAAGSDRAAYVAAMNQCAEKFIIQVINDIKKF